MRSWYWRTIISSVSWIHIDSNKKSFSIVFTPFLPPHKRMTNFFSSGKTAIRDSLPTFIIRLTEYTVSHFLFVAIFGNDGDASWHACRLLPFFFEIVYEKLYLKDPTVFKRQNGNMKLQYCSPTTNDLINMLLDIKYNTGENYLYWECKGIYCTCCVYISKYTYLRIRCYCLCPKEHLPCNFPEFPKGFIQNVADDSRFMQNDMGVPDLISLRNIEKHNEFINCYAGRIMASLTSLPWFCNSISWGQL